MRTPRSSRLPGSTAGEDGGPAAPPPLAIPDHTLLRRIGRGSYGEVWLARNVLGVYRAVKFIRRQDFEDDRPFERELAGIQRFEPISRSHESQLNILHVGRSPDCFYCVMELADDMGRGVDVDEASYSPRTLRSELLLRGRLPVDECLRLGLALTTALGHLHRHGLVHRDIKLSNIVFVNGIPKLADIGLVAPAQASASYVGTEGYLPPEGPGTVQADLFSLGKVLYEIGTGHDRQEFPDLPTNVERLPDRAALAEFNQVVLRACARDLKQRYATAAEMHADLALLQSGKSVTRLHTVERRLKLVMRSGLAVAAVAVLTGLAFFYQQFQTRAARRLSEENRKLAEENRDRVVRMDVANGIRLMDEGDLAGALLWLADALPRIVNQPATEEIHRIRIQQTLDPMPQIVGLVDCTNSIRAGAWSPDGTALAVTTWTPREGDPIWREAVWQVQLHEAGTGQRRWTAPLGPTHRVGGLRFSRDGRSLWVSSPADGPGAAVAFALETTAGQLRYPGFVEGFSWTAFSPDDRWLALVRTNQVIEVRRAEDGSLVSELRGHTDKIRVATFSGDGRLLASAGRDGTIRLWRMPAGEAVGVLRHEMPVRRVMFDDAARRLVTVTDSGSSEARSIVRLWDVGTQAALGEAVSDLESVELVHFCPGPGDRLLIVGTTDDRREVRIWSPGGRALATGVLDSQSNVRSWDISPGGERLAVGSDSGWVTFLGTVDGQEQGVRLPHGGYIESIRFSPDGTRLLTTSDDGMARVWQWPGRSESATLRFPANLPDIAPERQSGRVGAGGGPLFLQLADRTLRLVNPEPLREEFVFPLQKPGARMTGGPGWKGETWVTIEAETGDGGVPRRSAPCDVYLWRRAGGQFRHRHLPHPKLVLFWSLTADDARLLTFCADWSVRIWRGADGTLERTVPVPEAYRYLPLDLGSNWFSPDGQSVLVAHGEGQEQIQLFDLSASRLVGRPFPRRELGLVNKLTFAPDGHRLAKVGNDQMGAIVDLHGGTLSVPAFKHTGDLLHLDWSPDGRRLLTAGLSPRVRAWDSRTGVPVLAPILTGSKAGRAARWSGDGRFLVTRNDDGTARVWDAATAEAITPPLAHAGQIRWACIAGSNRLITASDPNVLRAWDLRRSSLPPEALVARAQLLAGRRLTGDGVLVPLKGRELMAVLEEVRRDGKDR